MDRDKNGLTSVGEVNNKKADERPLFERNDTSKKEELWDYKEDEELVARTPDLKANPEALGMLKKNTEDAGRSL